ncbi:fibronectin type III domain-containing protein [Gabonibacter massiliensis]|uniref:fibronectin type III domain-containing protein n=1 Tax=Gabonibacter massiliensis TaxID=1720195 RepID=UPI00073F741D|nr:fibronectin type III domain-containing protein [Gabonibacter massiliensis]
MKKISKNVLKRFLFVCLGLVFTTIVVATVVLEPPGPPTEPMIIEKTPTSCTITYKKPLRDGGSKIVAYFIESQYSYSDRWVDRGGTKELKHTVINLTPGSKVKFRIMAVNKIGRSEPVETDEVALPVY